MNRKRYLRIIWLEIRNEDFCRCTRHAGHNTCVWRKSCQVTCYIILALSRGKLVPNCNIRNISRLRRLVSRRFIFFTVFMFSFLLTFLCVPFRWRSKCSWRYSKYSVPTAYLLSNALLKDIIQIIQGHPTTVFSQML